MLGAASGVVPQAQGDTSGTAIALVAAPKSQLFSAGVQPSLFSAGAQPSRKRTLIISLLVAIVAIGGAVGAALAITASGSSGDATTSTAAANSGTSTVSFTLGAQGDVSDYAPLVVQGLATAFAAEAGVATSACEVSITSASVLIAVSITTTASESTAILAALASVLSDPNATTAFLATAPTGGFSIVVTAVVSPPTASTVTESNGDGGSDAGSDAGSNVGGDPLSDPCDAMCQACRSDSTCVGMLSVGITTGDRSTVVRVGANGETGDGDGSTSLRQRRQLHEIDLTGPSDTEKQPSVELIMSGGRRLQTDEPAADCSMGDLQALSLAWRANISDMVAQLYDKKAELSAASMVLLQAYRNRYSAGTANVAADENAWDTVTGSAANASFATAENETGSTREEVRRLRDELGVMARQHITSIRGYAAIARQMQACRRLQLGLPAPSNRCDAARLAEYDRLGGMDATAVPNATEEEIEDEALGAANEVVADGVIELHADGSLEAINETDCDTFEGLAADVDRARGELSCQFKWVMKKVSEMLREAKRVLVHYNSWMRRCGGVNRNGRTAEREAYCVRVADEMQAARETVSALMRRANAVGRRLMKQHRNVARTLEARQRCAQGQLTPHADTSAVVAGEAACGPLAPISIGNIMDTIEPLMGEADNQVGELLGGAVYENLRHEVSRVSAKLFCAAQELTGRVPIESAIELLVLYKQYMRGCGGGFNDARGMCGAQYQLDRANPEIGRTQARANSRVCVAAAREEKSACTAQLAPRLQAKRAEIGDAMRALNEDAREVWRWIQVQARLLQPKYDALMAQMQAHVARYSELEGFKRLQRGLMGDQFADYGGGTGRRLSELLNSSTNATAEVQMDQAWLLEEVGMGDFVEATVWHDENRTAPRIQDFGYGDDEDDTTNTCDVWMLEPPAWFLQCPDICVPFCCPRQGCCSGCEARSSCTGTFLRNLTQTETCYSCFTTGCEHGSGVAPDTCMLYDEAEGGITTTGPHAAPSLPRLSADSGIMAFGPTNPRDSKPDTYLVLIASIRMCRQLVCDGVEEGTRSVSVPGCQASGDAYCVGDQYTVDCIRGYYSVVPSSCVTLYETANAVVSPSSPRLSTDSNGSYVIDSASQCGRIRELQQQGLYLDLADPTAGLDIAGVTLRASDVGNYSFMQIQLAGDYIVRAEVPLTSGARLYTQPCGCEACPNDAASSATGLAQPNPDVMCGGGGCSSCAETPQTEFSASGGAMKDELGPQVRMCANDL